MHLVRAAPGTLAAISRFGGFRRAKFFRPQARMFLPDNFQKAAVLAANMFGQFWCPIAKLKILGPAAGWCGQKEGKAMRI